MNDDLILRSRARFARRLEGWQQANVPDGSRCARGSATALPDALLTMRKQDVLPEKQ
jgi:hypothetical protein